MTAKQKPPEIAEAEKAGRVFRFVEIHELRAARKGEQVKRPDQHTLNESLLSPEDEAAEKEAKRTLEKWAAKFRAMKTDAEVSMAATAAVHAVAQRAILGSAEAMEFLLNFTAKLVEQINAEVQREDFFNLALDVTKKMEVWPVNYRPDAGDGDGEWLPAKKRYEDLKCGTESTIPHRAGSHIDPKDFWQKLVADALIVIESARSEIVRLPRDGKRWRRDRRIGRLRFREDYIALPDGAFFVCPAWVLKVPALPLSLNAEPRAWMRFHPVVWELVQRFWLTSDATEREAAITQVGGDPSRGTMTPYRDRLRQSLRQALQSLAGDRKAKGRETQ
jgi:hypothetical protein